MDDENMCKLKRDEENVDQSDNTAPKQAAQHELTHCSYRSWCEVCVGAISLNGHHR